ncbi:hypothetical protein GX888_02680 [Candidatus Dojkabacteria bacterium]|uniref:TrbC/VirB2 family protein n=1 Tax=Candidatus Dojkabacteria bacterium TaxID=2099670 RepID=A0A847VDS1_9BACT|nr:hypothetical protein [Candidatus Dojkabacteria bacterium]
MINSVMSYFVTKVYAADTQEPPQLGELFNSLDNIIQWIHPIGVVIASAILILGGYMWMTSGGDPNRKQQAQGVLTWGIAGLVFLFLVRGLIIFISRFLSPGFTGP